MKSENNDLYAYLGKKIQEKRKELKISQEKLAEIINTDYVQIYRWEKAIRKIPFDKLLKLAEFFNVPLEYFYGDFKQNIQKKDTSVVKYPLNPELDKRVMALKEIYSTESEELILAVNNCIDNVIFFLKKQNKHERNKEATKKKKNANSKI
ncbi:MAG: helix-turn-helix domain-containing protein [bacterium]